AIAMRPFQRRTTSKPGIHFPLEPRAIPDRNDRTAGAWYPSGLWMDSRLREYRPIYQPRAEGRGRGTALRPHPWQAHLPLGPGLVVDAEARRWHGLQPRRGNGLVARLAGPVRAGIEPLERLLHLAELVVDLLEQGHVLPVL